MSILLLNQYFRPDTAATGQLLSDVADYLSETGEMVDVICGGTADDDGGSSEHSAINVIRMRSYGGSRILSYLRFLAFALWKGLRVRRPQVVVTLTTPPLLSLVGLAIQKLRGARHIIWEMDVYPDVAIDLGVLKTGVPLTRMLEWLADLPRKHADRVMVLGECMRTRLLAHGIASEKIFIAENWALQEENEFESRDLNVFPAGPLSVLYSGNLGMAHDAQTIALSMLQMTCTSADSSNEIRFVFAGGGSRHAWLRKFCEEQEISDALFVGYCHRSDLSGRLREGHIGLVTQKPECLGSSIPSKAYGIMAAGRPILFIGPAESTTARMIKRYGCGWQFECGDSEGVARLLRQLTVRRDLVEAAGALAYDAFDQNYRRSIGVVRVARALGLPDEQLESTRDRTLKQSELRV